MYFNFLTNEKTYHICIETLRNIIHDYDISETEALQRINEDWKGLSLEEDVFLIDEDPKFWSDYIYKGIAKGKLGFNTNSDGYVLCLEIVRTMKNDFGISTEEAIGRIRSKWKGNDIIDEDDLVFYEGPDYWAYDIYYGLYSAWWQKTKEELAELSPLPYNEE
ncbi:hypothetical protein [Chengkuizengella marina]|uniref:Uncharacterized protein n=1 Tax=Chengkuizengella marina TaxID=2507566 RepID=A0A6N9PY30_9BACL|nr:hypothetical protein [Chengkuizengella marina]NBI28431.1 hypothetical protein [Chengkuizengella marina]